MYDGVPLAVDSIAMPPGARLLMPKSLSLTHQSLWGGSDLTKTFCRRHSISARETEYFVRKGEVGVEKGHIPLV
jgi:hypothetical protein